MFKYFTKVRVKERAVLKKEHLLSAKPIIC